MELTNEESQAEYAHVGDTTIAATMTTTTTAKRKTHTAERTHTKQTTIFFLFMQ